MKHTPGPWVRDVTGVYTEGYKSQISHSNVGAIPWEERIANAHLITAAPELLEALNRAKHLLEEYAPGCPKRFIQELDAIIAKAEGRS